MCGIVGILGDHEVAPLILDALKRLEYRGYDSAGVAVLKRDGGLGLCRTVGKVAQLEDKLRADPLEGRLGIAHTRWATHGGVTEANAHPHLSGDRVAVIHNGIIENYATLKRYLEEKGHVFTSETDTEVIAHLLASMLERTSDLAEAVRGALVRLVGAYALAVLSPDDDRRLIVARSGSPLVVGLGVGETFIASDVFALLPVTQRFVFLHDGDIVDLTSLGMSIYNAQGEPVERAEIRSELSADAVERGEYRHYMLKEIYEQPRAVAETLEGRLANNHVLEASFGPNAAAIFDQIQHVQIIACGTSFHAGLVARYGFESLAGIPCNVEVASEFRYRHAAVLPNTLFVTISQSGETADTLAALRAAKSIGFQHTLSICNVPESSLVRESDLVLMTRAGPEIGVASTKAFTTQLVALLLLIVVLGRRHKLKPETESNIVKQLRELPGILDEVLKLDTEIQALASRFGNKHNALFLGRVTQYPIAMEGALKLKEISYIHAEGYPAAEMKHGPIALIDEAMPVVAIAVQDSVYEKMISQIEQVKARGGIVIALATEGDAGIAAKADYVLCVPPVTPLLSPVVNVVPLQLLAYHLAVRRGCDVDQPRNLAKSVTVE